LPRLLRVAPDSHLVGLVREGRAAAFEAVYDRHHRAILSFCRHMLGSTEEAEDAVQQTFLSAYNDLMSSDKPIHLRAWLFAIARNRCYSVLRSRREQPVGELDEIATEGLAAQVQRRQDLRDLVFDLQLLPDEQRAALVLAEMDALSHDQIATVLGVPREKVKALVFQARESLIASRAARETDCSEIREQLSSLRGGGLRRANLRRHLRECSGCREFRQQIDRQRRQLRIVLPVVPTLALKETVLAATVGGGATVSAATVGGGGALAGSLLKGGAVKVLIGAVVAGVGTAGTLVAVHDVRFGVSSRPNARHRLVSRAPFTLRPAVAGSRAPRAGSARAPAAGAASAPSSAAAARSHVSRRSGPGARSHSVALAKRSDRTLASSRIAVASSSSKGGAPISAPPAAPELATAPAAVAPSQPDAGGSAASDSRPASSSSWHGHAAPRGGSHRSASRSPRDVTPSPHGSSSSTSSTGAGPGDAGSSGSPGSSGSRGSSGSGDGGGADSRPHGR
jgi:RNA polymerase sigma factor (sigma-70 family)